MSPAALTWAWWGLTRILVVIALVSFENGAGFDLKYYDRSLGDFGSDGFAHTMREYPVPAVLVLGAPYGLLSLLDATSGFPLAIIVLAVVLDAAFLRALLDRSTAASGPLPFPGAVLAWLVALPAIGAVAYARFDLLPGVLIGLAVLWLLDAPRRAGVAVALATGAKYWPALVIPAFGAVRSRRARFLVSGAVAGATLVSVSLVLGGWDRIVSPLDYQGDRGLQIESVAATPAMIGWALDPERYDVAYASSLAWEVDGPGVGALLRVTTGASVLLVVALLALWLAAWRRPVDARSGLSATVWLSLAGVSAFIVSGKVLSPQYLLWLLPLACAGLAVLDDPAQQARLRRWTMLLLVAAVLTHVLYPHAYWELLEHSGRSVPVVGVLAVRNLILVTLCGLALAAAVGQVRSGPRHPTDPPVSAGA